MVIVTSAIAFAQGAFDTVQRKTIGPLPLVCVKVAPGVVAFGLNVPAPPPCTVDIAAAAPAGGLLPRPAAVLPAQTVGCEPDDRRGGCLTVITASAVALVPQVGLV